MALYFDLGNDYTKFEKELLEKNRTLNERLEAQTLINEALTKQLALCSVGSEAELLADKKQDFLEVCKDFVKWMDGYHKKQTKS